MSCHINVMPTVRPYRGAFATVTAVALIGIVGAVLAMLAGLLASQVKRNIAQTQDAQLRQLLIAGEVAVHHSLGGSEVGPVVVPLPPELQSAGLSLSFEILAHNGAKSVDARMTARTVNGHSLSQTLRYVSTDNGWQLRSAEL
jgi:hypothetical protein